MGLIIRSPDPARDYGFVAEIRSLCEHLTITCQDLKKQDYDCREGSHVLRIVGEVEGFLVGSGLAVHTIWHAPGIFGIDVCVLPTERHKGYGHQLLSFLEKFVLQHQGLVTEARIRDSELRGLSFADQCGYFQAAHTFE